MYLHQLHLEDPKKCQFSYNLRSNSGILLDPPKGKMYMEWAAFTTMQYRRLTLFASLTYAYHYRDDANKIKFSSMKSKLYRKCTCMAYQLFCLMADGWYFLQYCLQIAENCTNCSTWSALSTFAFSSHNYTCTAMDSLS